MLRTIMTAGTGGFTDSAIRYPVQIPVGKGTSGTFPWGTVIANIAGCLIVRIIYAITEKRNLMIPGRQFLTAGIFGVSTTSCAFAFSNRNIFKDNSFYYFLLNMGGNLILGILVVYTAITGKDRRAIPIIIGGGSGFRIRAAGYLNTVRQVYTLWRDC